MKTTLIVLAVAAALVSASAPAYAAKNTGAFQQSSEANRQFCADLRLLFQLHTENMKKSQKGSADYNKQRDMANQALGTAVDRGCGWAQ